MAKLSKRLDKKGETPQKKGTTKNRAMAGSAHYYPDDLEKALKRQSSLHETERSYKMDTARKKYDTTKKADTKKYGFTDMRKTGLFK